MQTQCAWPRAIPIYKPAPLQWLRMTIPAWVPAPVAHVYGTMPLDDRQRVIAERLISNTRMFDVWQTLKRKNRATGQFMYAVEGTPQEQALAELFRFVVVTAGRGVPAMTRQAAAEAREALRRANGWQAAFVSAEGHVPVAHRPENPEAKGLQLTIGDVLQEKSGFRMMRVSATLTSVALGLDIETTRWIGRRQRQRD